MPARPSGVAAPQRERIAHDLRGMLGVPGFQRAASVLDEAREALGVELVRAHPQAVAGRRRREDLVAAERLAQP